jgi:DNA-binding transcriptional LysR family regulator
MKGLQATTVPHPWWGVSVDLDLSLAASFLVLAEEGHYGRAAARLHMTSSALSKRIQRLERQLGVTVIDRGPVGLLRVTSAGRRFAGAVGPLLAHADAVRETARTRPDRYTVRIGFPAGTLASLSLLGLKLIARDVRRSYPEARLVGREIAFTELTRCLPDQCVDVLWTNSSVRHVAVESHPTQVGTALIGVVAARHRLADAGSIDVEQFCEEPMLYSPAVPEEWMAPFWLADLRSKHEARLVEVDAQDQASVLRKVAGGDAVIASVAMMRPLLGPQLRAVTLLGSPRMGFYAAHRSDDHRGAVKELLNALQAVPPDALI